MVDKSEAEAVDLVLKLREKLVSGLSPSLPLPSVVSVQERRIGGARQPVAAEPFVSLGKCSCCVGIPLAWGGAGLEGARVLGSIFGQPPAPSGRSEGSCPGLLLPGWLTRRRRGLALWLVPLCRSKPGAEASRPERRHSSECVSTSPLWSGRCLRTSRPFCVTRKWPLPAEGSSSGGGQFRGEGAFPLSSLSARGAAGGPGRRVEKVPRLVWDVQWWCVPKRA